eukprot:Gb_25615 [translate_table: standard]
MAGFGKSALNFMGKGDGNSMIMTITNTPAAELALTNCAYCSPSDLRKFTVPGLGHALASVGPSVVLTIRYPLHLCFQNSKKMAEKKDPVCTDWYVAVNFQNSTSVLVTLAQLENLHYTHCWIVLMPLYGQLSAFTINMNPDHGLDQGVTDHVVKGSGFPKGSALVVTRFDLVVPDLRDTGRKEERMWGDTMTKSSLADRLLKQGSMEQMKLLFWYASCRKALLERLGDGLSLRIVAFLVGKVGLITHQCYGPGKGLWIVQKGAKDRHSLVSQMVSIFSIIVAPGAFDLIYGYSKFRVWGNSNVEIGVDVCPLQASKIRRNEVRLRVFNSWDIKGKTEWMKILEKHLIVTCVTMRSHLADRGKYKMEDISHLRGSSLLFLASRFPRLLLLGVSLLWVFS